MTAARRDDATTRASARRSAASTAPWSATARTPASARPGSTSTRSSSPSSAPTPAATCPADRPADPRRDHQPDAVTGLARFRAGPRVRARTGPTWTRLETSSLAKTAADVRLDGRDSHIQRLGDLRVRQSLADRHRDLALPVRQPGPAAHGPRAAGSRRPSRLDGGDEPGRDAGRQARPRLWQRGGSRAPARPARLSLRRKPVAPWRSAVRTMSSGVERRQDDDPGGGALLPQPPGRGQAVHRGIRMSIRTTSGCSRTTRSTASCPSAASPTTSKSGTPARIIRRPGPHHRVVVGEDDADRGHAGTAASPGGRSPRRPRSRGRASRPPVPRVRRGPPARRRPRAAAPRPEARGGCGPLCRGSSRGRRQSDGDRLAGGVLAGVREAFLDDAERGAGQGLGHHGRVSAAEAGPASQQCW